MSLEPVILNTLNFTNKSIYSAAAFSLISQNISESSVDDAFMLADRRNVFDELAYDLAGLNLANNTSETAFESLSDSTAIATNTTLVEYVNNSSYLIEKFKDSNIAKNNFGVKTIKTLNDIDDLRRQGFVDIRQWMDNASQIHSFDFSADGTRLYALNANAFKVYSFTLSTAWDVTTATPDNLQILLTTGVPSIVPTDIRIASTGLRLYVASSEGYVYQYNLSTAWNISTATYSTFGDIRSYNPNGFTPKIAISTDGTRLFLYTNNSNQFVRYTMPAWNVGSITSPVTFNLPNSFTTFDVNTDGTKAFFFRSDGLLQSFTMSTPYNTSTSVITSEVLFSSYYSSPFYSCVRLSPDGLNLYLGYLILGRYTLPAAWTFFNRNVGTITLTQDTAATGFTFSADGTKLYVIGTNNDRVRQYELSVAWDITTATYPVDRFVSISSQDLQAQFIAFSPNGLNMYIGGANNDRIYQYTLSVAWDVSTAVFLHNSGLLSSQENNSFDIAFKPDGTKLYIIGTTADTIFEYNLTTPWNISTLVYSNNSINVGNISYSSPVGLAFSPDGTKILLADTNTGKLITIFLAIPWNLSSWYHNTDLFYSHGGIATCLKVNNTGTRVYWRNGAQSFRQASLFEPYIAHNRTLHPNEQYMHFPSTNVIDFDFSTDGRKMVVLTSAVVKEYDLRIPFNASTSADTGKSYTHTRASPTAIRYSPDGGSLFIVAETTYVFVHKLASPFNITNIIYTTQRSFAVSGVISGIQSFDFSANGRYVNILVTNPALRIVQYELAEPYNLATQVNNILITYTLDYACKNVRFTNNGSHVIFNETTARLSLTPLSTLGDLRTIQSSQQENFTINIFSNNCGIDAGIHLSEKYLNVAVGSGNRIYTFTGFEVNKMEA